MAFATSSQITKMLLESPNPLEAEKKIWENSRYLIAQFPAYKGDNTTANGYYNGHVVVPGPRAHRLAGSLSGGDWSYIKSVYRSRFVDNNTTDGADEEIRRALFRPMTNNEADDYEMRVFGEKTTTKVINPTPASEKTGEKTGGTDANPFE